MSSYNRNPYQYKKKNNTSKRVLLYSIIILCCVFMWFVGKRINNAPRILR